VFVLCGGCVSVAAVAMAMAVAMAVARAVAMAVVAAVANNGADWFVCEPLK